MFGVFGSKKKKEEVKVEPIDLVATSNRVKIKY
jgi:hypothetical protein